MGNTPAGRGPTPRIRAAGGGRLGPSGGPAHSGGRIHHHAPADDWLEASCSANSTRARLTFPDLCGHKVKTSLLLMMGLLKGFGAEIAQRRA